jgi:hypothetical protein
MPIGGTISNFIVDMFEALNFGTVQFILMKNGVDTDIKITMVEGDTQVSNNTDTLTVSAGDLLVLKVVTDELTFGIINPSWSFLFDSDTAGSSILCSNLTSTIYPYDSVVSGHRPSGFTESKVSCVIPTAGTLKNLYVESDVDHTATKTTTLTLRKNGADTALAVTLNDTGTSFSNTSDEVAVVAGDIITFSLSTTDSIVMFLMKSMLFVPTTTDETMLMNIQGINITSDSELAGIDHYIPVGYISEQGSGSDEKRMYLEEAVRVVTNQITITDMYIDLDGVVDQFSSGQSITITLMKNGVATALTLTFNDAATTEKTITGSVAFAQGDKLSYSIDQTYSIFPATIARISLVGTSTTGHVILGSQKLKPLLSVRTLLDSSGTVDSEHINVGLGVGDSNLVGKGEQHTYLDTSVKKFGTSSLRCKDITVGGVAITGDIDFGFGNDAWSVDFWFRANALNDGSGLFGQEFSSTVSADQVKGRRMQCYFDADGSFTFIIDSYISNTVFARIVTATGLITVDSLFHHMEVSYDGNTYRMFLDGVLIGSDNVGISAWNSGTAYVANDSVLYDGIHYISRTSNTNQQPDTNPDDWAVSAYDITQVDPWSSTTAYQAFPKVPADAVSYDGSVYIAINDSTNQQPDTSPSFWAELAVGTSDIETALLNKREFQIGVIKGSSNVSNGLFDGWIDEFRISGASKHTSDFTPPVSIYGSDPTNKLLLHFD